MRAICGLTLAVLLSGCWMGPDFYAERSSEQPIEPGRYKLVDTYAMLPDAQEKLWREEPIGHRVGISYADDGTAIVTILDNDVAVVPSVLTIGPITVTEGTGATPRMA